MTFETGLEFGRHAHEINEAYEKMLHGGTILNEEFAHTRGLVKEPKPGDEDYISDDEFEQQKNFVNKLRERDADRDNIQLKNVETAEEPEEEEDEIDLLADEETGDTDDSAEEDEGGISAEEDFYNKVILGNPEWFNESEYDMEAIAAHKKELLDKAVKFILKGYDEKRAAAEALEEIPGCESKNVAAGAEEVAADSTEEEPDDGGSEDSVGNIDLNANTERDSTVPEVDKDDGFFVDDSSFDREDEEEV